MKRFISLITLAIMSFILAGVSTGFATPVVLNSKASDKGIALTFSMPMNPDSLTDGIMLKVIIPGVGYGTVAGMVKMDENNTKAVFESPGNLIPGLNYTIEITGGKSADGLDLEKYEWAFTASHNTGTEFSNAVFSNPAQIDNPYFPLMPKTVNIYQAETEDGFEKIIVEVLEHTRNVVGINCVVVRDRVYLNDMLIEDTHDWYARDDEGNVWYMGEEVDNYNYDDEDNLLSITHEGAWETGMDVAGIGKTAEPGIIMKASPSPGDSYRQEFYEGQAEDMADVVATGITVKLSNGTVYENCIQTRDWSNLDPGINEYKYYAPTIGFIREEKPDDEEIVEIFGTFLTGADLVPEFSAANFSNPTAITNTWMPLVPGATKVYQKETEDGLETIVTEVLNTTRIVNGVESVVFRDRVYLDDLIIEDTYDWFAQDDSGNVWYMGEEVVNYEYDDEGNLIGTNSGGSWEAGVDGAQAGIQMWKSPQAGMSYYQEYYKGEAEDMAMVVALRLTVELENGATYENCVKTLDWTPLEPTALEYKYYAPEVGFIMEQHVGGEELLDIKGNFATDRDMVPDFSIAAFSSPTVITNTFFPLPPGRKMVYQKETEDGLETIVTEVLDTTRVVNGVESVVFRDTVYLDDIVIEDTHDWFAQDDSGNVWYMGEEVINYEYDDEGNLVETNNEGSWEAGVDGAMAGIQMWNSPQAGISYYQEYYEGEAEDMAMIVAVGVTVEMTDGTVYENCVKTLDWVPLDQTALEYKYYAPGIGFIKEEDIAGGEILELFEKKLKSAKL